MLRNTQQAGGKVSFQARLISDSIRGGAVLTANYTFTGIACKKLTTVPQDPKREHRLIPILQFVHTQVYKYCFGKPADGLERSVEGEDECECDTQSADPIWNELRAT